MILIRYIIRKYQAIPIPLSTLTTHTSLDYFSWLSRQSQYYNLLETPLMIEDIPSPDPQFDKLSPQVKIYNRNFYVRREEHESLVRQRQRQLEELASRPKVSAQSYSILTQKLEKELGELLGRYSKEGRLDFQGFSVLVEQLGHFDGGQTLKRNLEEVLTQLWLLLVGFDLECESVDQEEIERLLIILFCPHPLRQHEIVHLLEDLFPDLQQSRARYVEEYPQAGDELLSLEAIVEVWLRVKHSQLSVVKKQAPAREGPDFQPRINPKSREYAQRSLQKYLSSNRLDNLGDSQLNELSGYISAGKQLSYHEILYRRGLEKQQLMKTSRQAKPLVPQKTLSSSEVKRLVTNLYVNKQRREDVDHQKLKEQEELKKCTFKPTLIPYQRPSSSTTVRNYEKEVERLEKGRKQKQKRKEAFDNLGRVKHSNLAPPSFIQREKPRLILQIKVGDRVEQLRLKGEQDPRLVAKKFIRMHGLAQQMQQVLQSIIQEQLTAL